MPYITNAELLLFYDQRRVLELLTDDSSSEPTVGDVASSPILTQLIASASAEIDSNCQQGKRYTRADLAALAGGDAQSAGLLKQLTADLAFGSLMARRGFAADQMKQLAPRYEDALLKLEQLYQGRTVFDLDYAVNAGVPTTTTIGKNRLNASQFNRMFGVWPDSNPSAYLFGYPWR